MYKIHQTVLIACNSLCPNFRVWDNRGYDWLGVDYYCVGVKSNGHYREIEKDFVNVNGKFPNFCPLKNGDGK